VGTEFQSHSPWCVTNCVRDRLQSRVAHRLAPSKSLSALCGLKTIEAAMRGARRKLMLRIVLWTEILSNNGSG